MAGAAQDMPRNDKKGRYDSRAFDKVSACDGLHWFHVFKYPGYDLMAPDFAGHRYFCKY
jgi:hypothetical protein